MNFIEKAKKIHNNKYSYKKSEYKGAKTKLVITCSIHGDFIQRPDHHLNGHGPLPFDFYLPEQNTCIEFDGLQHFKPIDWFGGVETFLYIQKNDRLKDEYCLNNSIKLLRIKYNDDIECKLEDIHECEI